MFIWAPIAAHASGGADINITQIFYLKKGPSIISKTVFTVNLLKKIALFLFNKILCFKPTDNVSSLYSGIGPFFP